MKKETILAYILLLSSTLTDGAEVVLRIGGGERFQQIDNVHGVRLRPLPGGVSELILQDLQVSLDSSSDLYLSFDQGSIREGTGNWQIQGGTAQVTDINRIRGSGSGAFFPESRLPLFPTRDTLFSSGILENGFTIQFWLFPVTLAEGEGIFVYRKPPFAQGEFQEISCRIAGRTLEWNFQNFFQGGGATRTQITLRGSTPLIPREWRHHTLRYDAATGLIEYLVDGVVDATVYATPSGREEHTLFFPVTQRNLLVPLILGDGFHGLMDEFFIERRFRETLPLNRHPAEGGWFETTPLDLGYHNSQFIKLSSRQTTPGNSAVFYYYRISNNLTELYTLEWIPLELGRDLELRARGRFLQLRGELFPDGSRAFSPRISELLVFYELNAPPPPPTFVQAIPGDGEVLLRWSRVPDPSVKGYFVYYGTEPGVFRGNDSTLGPSPIRVGNQTELLVTGLTNGKLYYFSISAYDSSEDVLSSRLSRTVNARPSRIFRNEQRKQSQ